MLYAKKTGDEAECALAVLGGDNISVEDACVGLALEGLDQNQIIHISEPEDCVLGGS